MDQESPTFQALSDFITSQQTLLERTRDDLERLKQLRDANYTSHVSGSPSFSSQAVIPLGDLLAPSNTVLEAIEWPTISSLNSTALRNLEASTKETHLLRSQPSWKQTGPLSPLQLLVQGAKKILLDPVFEALDLSYDPPPPTPVPVDEATAKRAFERAKIMDLKQRRFHGGSSLTVRRGEPEGVYVRMDVEDETTEVEIDLFGGMALAHSNSGVDGSDQHHFEQAPFHEEFSTLVPPKRRTSTAAAIPQVGNTRSTAASKKKKTKSSVRAKSEVEPEPPPVSDPTLLPASTPTTDTVSKGKKVKVKPDTYKLAWSVEEQHLLEQLLEKYPNGSKNRWQQISKAMNGRRTPRQVASRVQKYFEKLKRFGLEAEAEGASAGGSKNYDMDEGD